MFGRILIDPEKFDGQPYFIDTDIVVSDVIDMLATLEEREVLNKYPRLVKQDLTDALQYAAELIRTQPMPLEPIELPETGYYLGLKLALEHQETEPKYSLVDAETDKELLKATAYQVEYLKNNITEPESDDEGWYFTRISLATMQLDMQRVIDTVDALDERIEVIEKKRAEKGDEAVNLDELAKLIVRSDLFDVKHDELEQLYYVVETALGDYDAFEISWKLLEAGNKDVENAATG